MHLVLALLFAFNSKLSVRSIILKRFLKPLRSL